MKARCIQLLLTVWMIALVVQVRASAATPPSIDLVICSHGKPVHIQLVVDRHAAASATGWRHAFEQLLAFCDHSGDGSLDEDEAALLPSPLAIRRGLWGQFNPYPSSPVDFAMLDLDQNLRLGVTELQSFYESRGLDDLQIGIGHIRAAPALNDRWFNLLDGNSNGQIERREAQHAASLLKELDGNGDELLQPGEVSAASGSAGSQSSRLLAPSIRNQGRHASSQPLLVLPRDPADTYWASELLARLDRDENARLSEEESQLATDEFGTLDANQDAHLSAGELVEWRRLPSAAVWHIRLADGLSSSPAFAEAKDRDSNLLPRECLSLSTDGVRLQIVASAGSLAESLAKSRDRYRQMLTDHNSDDDAALSAKEIEDSSLAEVRHLAKASDRSQDGTLTRAELDAWLDLQTQFAANHVLLSIVHRGSGLFAFLDHDLDGNLSLRELHEAESRLAAAHLLEVDVASIRLPATFVGTASRGRTLQPFRPHRVENPAWFAGMDRNRDGDISRREFLGVEAQFEAADRNGDGLLSLAEASALSPP